MRRWVPVFGVLLAALSCAEPASWPAVGGKVPEIAGSDHRGQPFLLSADRTRASAVFFGYTFCPDVCPITLLRMKQLVRSLPAKQRDGLRVVFVTVDPARDTVARLSSYLEAFGDGFVGVHPNDVSTLVRDLSLTVEREEVTTSTTNTDVYAVNHTATVYLIGPDGRLAARFTHGTPAEEMRGPVLKLLERAK